MQTNGLHRKKRLSKLLHSGQTLLKLCDQIAMLGSLFPLGIDNCLGSPGDKLLVGQLGLQGVQELSGSFQLLVDSGQLLGNVNQLSHGDIELCVGSGDGHHAVQILGLGFQHGHSIGVGQTLDKALALGIDLGLVGQDEQGCLLAGGHGWRGWLP